jgi:hypothetical protein
MSNKIFCQILIIIFISACIGNHLTYAGEWEDDDTPISFKIEMLPWDEVNRIIPNKTKFIIIDIETGLQFWVQRRAGNRHADVQPLTREDTQIMKKIYNGKWSWKRKAVIVLVNDQMIAASMHGMPHGAGSLQNGFPGHFCVHFFGSITHRLKNEDLSHKLMILKAAGKLDDYLNKASPYELINIFTVAIDQEDQKLVNQIISDSDCPKCFNEFVKNIQFFGISILPPASSKDENGLLLVEILAKVNFYTKSNGREKKIVRFILRRESLTDCWLIDQESLYIDFKQKEG